MAQSLRRAIEVGPRGQGGALLIPTVNVTAALEHFAEQEDQIESLQDELEDLMVAQLVAERRDTLEDEMAAADAGGELLNGQEIERAADEGLAVVLVSADGSTRILRPEAAAH